MCAQPKSVGLALQGGGALGTYGAVNATLLCGARDPSNPLDTLTTVWDEFTIPLESITNVGNVPFVRTLPSTLSNPAMYRPRYTDYILKPLELTSVCDTSPLRETLNKHIAWDALVYNEKEQKPVTGRNTAEAQSRGKSIDA